MKQLTHPSRTFLFLLFCMMYQFASGQQTVGLFTQNAGSDDGYVLFSPIASDTTYLIDKCGKKVHAWASTYHPGQSVYLLENGSLLRTGNVNNPAFASGGTGGIVEAFDWSSHLIWSYQISDSTQCQHHDICPLPNGNVLAIVWESKSTVEAIASGRNPALLGASLWTEKIIELEPVGADSANIVWEWNVWDHLVQEFDPLKQNYGTIAAHPELINLNYIGNGPATGKDWNHLNSVSYNADLNQIILSSHNLNEIWVIDHSTSIAEAASHAGGAHGIGGDLLYRWGNPAAYNRGTVADKKLFGQHNAQWIANGFSDAGNIMIFNNGQRRPQGNYSTVDIISPPVDSAGNYSLSPGTSYLPDSAYWSYQSIPPTDFYATNISGAQRLSNGNTLICEGPAGNFFEIDSNRSVVWKYVNPVGQNGAVMQGTNPAFNSVFRCTLYEPDYSGLNGHPLVPGNPIEFNPLVYTCIMTTGIHKSWTADFKPLINIEGGQIEMELEFPVSDAQGMLYDVTGRLVQSWSGRDIEGKGMIRLGLRDDLQSALYFFCLRSAQLNLTRALYTK